MKYHFAALEDNIPEGCLYRVKPLYKIGRAHV